MTLQRAKKSETAASPQSTAPTSSKRPRHLGHRQLREAPVAKVAPLVSRAVHGMDATNLYDVFQKLMEQDFIVRCRSAGRLPATRGARLVLVRGTESLDDEEIGFVYKHELSAEAAPNVTHYGHDLRMVLRAPSICAAEQGGCQQQARQGAEYWPQW